MPTLGAGQDGLFVQWDNDTQAFVAAAAAGVTDHGALSGLGADDHTQYLLVDGSRAMTGRIRFGVQGSGVQIASDGWGLEFYRGTGVGATIGNGDFTVGTLKGSAGAVVGSATPGWPNARLAVMATSAQVAAEIQLAATQSANAINVTSSGGSAGDIFAVTAGGRVLVVSGSAPAPSIALASDPDTGIYSPTGLADLRMVIAGVERLVVNNSGIELRRDVTIANGGTKLLLPDGSAGAPALAFSSDTDAGWYYRPSGGTAMVGVYGGQSMLEIGAAGVVVPSGKTFQALGSLANLSTPNGQVVVTGVNAASVPFYIKGAAAQSADLQQWQISAGTPVAYIKSGGELRLPAGTFSNPALAFTGDQDMGILFGGANDFALTVSQVRIVHMQNASNGSAPAIAFLGATPQTQKAHIVDADGTLGDITTKFNTLLSYLESFGFIATS